MGEKDLWLKLGLIVAIVALSISFILPPEEKLKPGIDLGGGHSLLFEIDDSGDIDKTNLSTRVMDILKQRVDPGGNRNLIWRPIGRNRLEIQMPLPPKGQREAREAYEAAREALANTQITRSQIVNAVALPAAEREAAIEKLIKFDLPPEKDTDTPRSIVIESRRPLFQTLIETTDRYQQLSAAATQPESLTTEQAQEIDRLFERRNQTIDQLLQTNLDPRVLGDVLELDRTSDVRKQRVAEIKKNHPDLEPLITDLIARHEAYSKHKGYLNDPADLMRLLKGAGKLEFRIVAERDPSTGRIFATQPQYQEPVEKYLDALAKFGPRPQEGDHYRWFEIDKPDENSITQNPNFIVSEYLGTKYVLAHATPDMGLLSDGSWKLRAARPDRDRSGQLAVAFMLDTRGGNRFGELTGNNLKRPLGIFLDDKVVSAPSINDKITTNGIITGGRGGFTQQEVASLVNTLEAGVLPARLKEVPLQEKSVGPGLGATNREKGVIATAVALLVTLLFMAVYYSYSGFIANIALLMNFVITVGVMAFLGNTFTLPGIAGLILTLGMAVDANVLIYERIREELQRGVSVRMAVRLGYEKAFSAILDSNVTTIITAVILAYLGSEEIKGFGQTLGIGLCISMFTALFVTRQYFNVMLPTTLDPQETRKVGIATVVVALLGGAFLGLGYLLNTPDLREDSALVGLGKFFLIVFATAVVLLVTLWLFRVIYKVTGHQRANRMPMLKLLAAPKVDWMSKRYYFWVGSAIVVGGGMLFAWTTLRFDTSQILDIEFIGGTSVQVEVQDPNMKDEQLAEILTNGSGERTSAVAWLTKAADLLEKAQVTALDESRYLIQPGGDLTTPQIEAMLVSQGSAGDLLLGDLFTQGSVQPAAAGGVEVQLNPERAMKEGVTSAEDVKRLLAQTSAYVRNAADRLRNLRVQLVAETTAEGETRNAFELVTTETNKQLVAEAIMVPTRDILIVTRPIEARLATDDTRAPDGLYPIELSANTLGDVLGAEAAGGLAGQNIAPYKGGVLMVFDNITPAVSLGEIRQRFKDMRLQPDFDASLRDFTVIGLEAADGTDKYRKVAIAVVDPAIPYASDGKSNVTWRTQVAEKERQIAEAAFATSRSLQRVTQFAPQVASEAAMKAVIAVIISLIAIAIYLWVRFGAADFGLCGIIALYHDVAVALAAVIACHSLHDTAIGHLLGLKDFRIDLSVIAALMTIVGFSINDTIVIFDRIRENRGRLATISSELINRSLNETMSRTIITTLTVLLTVLVLYIFGGDGIHAFAFTMLVGCISGTYSTIAVATPMLRNPRTMWTVSLGLAALTLLGLSSAIDTPWLSYTLIVLILVATAYGAWRIINLPGPRAQVSPAA
ncbi:MAG TPA: protein translocase subunit SecD [Phycisphaerae bacterium]|nr:protein translocase subunit SecD [Phycisphaerae bacterium]